MTGHVPPPCSLEQLYLVVPATEEEDLLEQLREERQQYEGYHGAEQFWPLPAPWLRRPSPAPPSDGIAYDGPDLTHAQAVGLVLHLLGGRVITPGT